MRFGFGFGFGFGLGIRFGLGEADLYARHWRRQRFPRDRAAAEGG